MGYVLLWLFLGVVVGLIANRKGRNPLAWGFYGMMIFPVALIHALLLRDDRDVLEHRALREGLRKCPHCAEVIKPEANVCRYCGRDVQPVGVVASQNARGV